jgi:hypothetical protein
MTNPIGKAAKIRTIKRFFIPCKPSEGQKPQASEHQQRYKLNLLSTRILLTDEVAWVYPTVLKWTAKSPFLRGGPKGIKEKKRNKNNPPVSPFSKGGAKKKSPFLKGGLKKEKKRNKKNPPVFPFSKEEQKRNPPFLKGD